MTGCVRSTIKHRNVYYVSTLVTILIFAIRNMPLYLSVQLFDPRVKSIRCGVVPYTYKSGHLYFCLGRDRTTGELGDFGGGVKKDERVLSAGLREFAQETKGIFGERYSSINNVTNKVALCTPQMTIIFVPVSPDWIEKAPELFRNKSCTDKHSNEMTELVWLDERSLRYHVTSGSSKMIWRKVKTFFRDNFLTEREIGNWLRHIYLS